MGAAVRGGPGRDHRVRWILNEVDWPYEVRLVDAPTMKSASYRHRLQPFGQLPVLEETGRPPMFESGAIVLDVAMRAGRFIGAEGTADRSAVIQWVVAGLNSIEPFLFNVAEVDYFMDDEAAKATRRPVVVAQAKARLAMLEQARDGREWFVGDAFSACRLMIASILKIARNLDLLTDLPALAAWQRSVPQPSGPRESRTRSEGRDRASLACRHALRRRSEGSRSMNAS